MSPILHQKQKVCNYGPENGSALCKFKIRLTKTSIKKVPSGAFIIQRHSFVYRLRVWGHCVSPEGPTCLMHFLPHKTFTNLLLKILSNLHCFPHLVYSELILFLY